MKKQINFVFFNENTEQSYQISDLNCTDDEFHNWLETFNYGEIEEKFGIHDYSGSETEELNEVGFSSYEIKISEFDTVIELWRVGLLKANLITEEHKVEIIGGGNKATKKINEKELELAAKMLELASDTFCNHGCNDVDDSMYEGWTLEERQAFVKEFHEWNGDPDEYDEDFLHLGDSTIMDYLAAKLRK